MHIICVATLMTDFFGRANVEING